MVEAYWELLVGEKATQDNERRRWLRIDTLEREVQARKYVEALTGKPLPDGGTVPEYGGERARKQLWGVLVKSKNETMTSRWLRSCDAATAFGDGATIYRDEL